MIYSLGGYGLRTELAEKGAFLASHGYVAVSVDTWDASGTVFPDGTYLPQVPFSVTDAGFQDRVKDLLFVLDELSRWNTSDPVFAGRLNVTNVATMGYSWGGGVAGEVARIDARCRAAIILEGYFQNATDLLRFGLDKPSFSIYADPITLPGSELPLYKKATHDATWLQIHSTNHDHFNDYYWFVFTSPSALAGAREAERTMIAYTLWFLNKYLKGINDPAPDPIKYRLLDNFKQK